MATARGGPTFFLSVPHGLLVRKLELLDSPFAATFLAPLTEETYCKQIVWLEEEKIRFYTQNQRLDLRNIQHQNDWWTALYKYCADIGIQLHHSSSNQPPPIPPPRGKRLAILERLVNLALHDVYLDSRHLVVSSTADATGPTTSSLDPHHHLTELVTPLNRVLDMMSLPKLEDPADIQHESIIPSAIHCVAMRVKCFCGSTAGDGEAEKPDPNQRLDQFPISIQTKNKDVRNIAATARLLHSGDLRILQCYINSVIARLQEITSDPKTDTRIGRVGR